MESFFYDKCCFFFLMLYVIISEYGRLKNAFLAKKWFETLFPLLTNQFVQVGIKRNDPMPLHIRDPGYFISYATGRIHIAYLYIQFKFLVRQNFLSFIRQVVVGFFSDNPMPHDRLYIDMIVEDHVFDACVFAVVNKSKMRWLREKYYNLSFTCVMELPILPETYVVMSEFCEIASILLENNESFIQCIKTPDVVLEYLIVSDLPIKCPKSPDQTYQKTVSFCVKLPSLCYSQQVACIFSECIAFVDLLAGRAHWRSNISQKLKSIREEANKKLKKRQDEEKLANALKKKSEKDKQKKERIRNLSSQEQRKYLDKERERKYKKLFKVIKA
ncbi:hypothetical protein PNEG_00696 [Pneumocystis murina B123]|uniref:Coiled-coil domain-containing protein 47 n=1 Tax=Pneumocystis murina (strain B123) TaxID=1069680 RepID=M7NUW5_PNEMU|nr:hypothetical protein PNEG_00696 [Pneumocystis murina B123]EMR11097.1 hypothetical protein PNEG_00696 [Pneumocystis murina B123]